MKKMLVIEFFTYCWYEEWLLVSKKNNVSGESTCKSVRICTSTVCKNIVDKFVIVTLL